ncbi:hypothetical protein CPB86DRAFT_197673 [Serendipita vermifera]|nr:hypothetical protein CPB86DRAFT_197673 [Serendipita vermifera]
MKRLEGELVANGENEEPPATSTPVTQLAPRSLAPVPQLNQASASNRPGIHNKKVVGARQTLALSEYVQAAFATPKSSRRPPTTPKTTQIQEEMPSSAASTSHRAALAAQNFSKLISNGEDISAPSSPLRSLANQLNIHSDSEDSGSVYQANEEEEQEFMSPPKPNKGKGKAKVCFILPLNMI